MIKAIKKYLRNKKLSALKEKHTSSTTFVDINKARKILLVFEGTNLSRLGRINKIIESFMLEGIEVTSLSFFNEKELADICLVQDKIDFVCKNEFSRIGFPQEHIVDSYFNKNYDLALLLDMKYCSTTELFMDMADATLKAGKAGVLRKDALDFVIELEDDKDETFLVKQIKYYLRSIKSGS